MSDWSNSSRSRPTNQYAPPYAPPNLYAPPHVTYAQLSPQANQNLQSEITALRDQVSWLSSQNHHHAHLSTTKGQEITSLQHHLRETINSSENRTRQLEAERDSLRGEVERTRADRAAWVTERGRLVASVEVAKRQMRDLEERLGQEMEKEGKELRREVVDLKVSVQQWRTGAEEAEARKRPADPPAASVKTEPAADSSSYNNRTYLEQADSQRTQIEELTASVNRWRRRAETAERIVSQSTDTKPTVNHLPASLHTPNISRDRLEEAEALLQGVRAEMETWRAKAEGMQEDLETAQGQVEELMGEMEGLQAELRERPVPALKAVDADEADDTDDAKHENIQVKREPSPIEINPRITKLQQESAALFADRVQLLRRNVAMQRERDDALTATQVSRMEQEAMQERIDASDRRVVEVQRAMVALQRERDDARRAKEKWREEMGVLKLDLKIAQDEVRRVGGGNGNKAAMASAGASHQSGPRSKSGITGTGTIPLTGRHVPSSLLTPETHSIIASFLAGNDAYRSLANYSATCRVLQDALSPVLNEAVILDDDTNDYAFYGTQEIGTRAGTFATGWSQTKYLFLTDNHLERLRHLGQQQSVARGETRPTGFDSILMAFPNLRFHVSLTLKTVHSVVEAGEVPETTRNAALKVHQPVDALVLHEMLNHVYVRYSPDKPGKMCRLDELTQIEYRKDAYIVNEELVPPVARYRNRTDRDLELVYDVMPDGRLQATLWDSLRFLPRAKSSGTVTIRLPMMRLDLSSCVCKNLDAILVGAPYPIRFEGSFPPGKKRPTQASTVRSQFKGTFEAFVRVWYDIPVEMRLCATQVPIWRTTTLVEDERTVEFTITATAEGMGLVADVVEQNRIGTKVESADGEYPKVYGFR